jgi:hypothetical protein
MPDAKKNVPGFEAQTLDFEGVARPVYRAGVGPAVIQDPMCPGERFARLHDEFGNAFEAIEIDAKHANPRGPKPAHSVLTNHLIDEAGEPTREALDRTLEFLKEQLGSAV